MKKQQKLKQEKPVKKKEPLTFDQRFKDKKNHVGKLGVLDLLGLHQPFNLDRVPTPIIQPIVEVPEAEKNPQKQAMPKRKLSYNQNPKQKSKDPKFRTNKTDVVKNRQKETDKSQKLGLPRISKSSANIALDVDTKQLSTKQYWRGRTKTPILKKRANSQLSCLNMIKVDYDANVHFENLAKFEKLNKNHKKSIRIQKI